MKGRDPTGSDASQQVLNNTHENLSDLGEQKLEGQPRGKQGGNTCTGTRASAMDNLHERKSKQIDHSGIPYRQNALLAGFFGPLLSAGGYKAIRSGEEDVKVEKNLGDEISQLGVVGIVRPEDEELTDLVDTRMPNVFQHEGGKYTDLGVWMPEGRDRFLDTFVSEERDGRRLNALYAIRENGAGTDTETLRNELGVGGEFLSRLNDQGIVETQSYGVSATEKGRLAKHLFDELYETMDSVAKEQAETYACLLNNAEYLKDGIKVFGDRRMIGPKLREKGVEFTGDAEAFEDYM